MGEDDNMKLIIDDRDDNTKAAIELMRFNEQFSDEALLGTFWYSVHGDELFGVVSSFANDLDWYYSDQWKTYVKTDKRLHKDIWRKEHYKGKDKRFSGDHTYVPRGRVFEFKDKGYRVYTGRWIKDYPQAKQLIIDEFQLPPDKTEFIIDSHWDVGHGWTQEF